MITTGVNHKSADGIAGGIPARFGSEGCAIVKADLAISKTYVFTHEVGHLFGGRHEDDSSNLPARAHEFDANLGAKLYHFLTIMHNEREQILNFSNPNKKYLGVPTGTVDRNNACKMQEFGCGVSRIVGSQDYRITVSPSFNCGLKKLNLSFTYKQDNGNICPVAYWEISHSFDGINYLNANLSFAPFHSITYNDCRPIFVKIKAFGGNPSTLLATAFEWFEIPVLCDCKAIPLKDRDNSYELVKANHGTRLILTPNPTSNFLNIVIGSEVDDKVHLRFFDMNGKLVLDLPEFLTKNRSNVNISSLPSGTYFVSCIGSQTNLTSKFIKS